MPGLTGCREIDLKVYTSYQFREGVGEKKQTLVRKRIAYWILRLLIQPASLPSWEFSGHLLFRGCDSGALQILTWNLGEWFVVTPHRRRPRIIIPSAFPQCRAVAQINVLRSQKLLGLVDHVSSKAGTDKTVLISRACASPGCNGEQLSITVRHCSPNEAT